MSGLDGAGCGLLELSARVARWRALLGRSCVRPEDFEAAGMPLECDARDYSECGEYRLRLRAGLPTRAPRWRAGDWAYDWLHQRNVRVLTVYWVPPVGSCMPFWRACTAGHGAADADLAAPHPGAPYLEHAQLPGSPHTWGDALEVEIGRRGVRRLAHWRPGLAWG